MKDKLKFAENCVNFSFCFVGMVGLWLVTHNWLAIFWCFVASIHFGIRDYIKE